jgi:hypothetical protein
MPESPLPGDPPHHIADHDIQERGTVAANRIEMRYR